MNELLVISPILFILCITVQARTRVDAFIPHEYSKTLDDRLHAYIEPVKKAEQLLDHGTANVDPEELIELGKMWRDLTEKGVLAPLPPEAPDDTTKDGVKSQVRIAADLLASALQHFAHQSEGAGKYYAAASDAVLAIESTQAIKYSDLYSVGIMTARQNASLLIVRDLVPKLTREQREEIAHRLRNAQRLEKPFADSVLAEQRIWRYDTSDKGGLAKQDVDLMLRLARSLDSRVSRPAGGGLGGQLKSACRRGRDEALIADFRFAWTATRNSQEHWAQLERRLSFPQA